jgi:hypothetical protein
MNSRIRAAIDQIESERQGLEPIPDDVGLEELVDGVIRGKYRLTANGLRTLIAWMPHFAPKLQAVGFGYLKPGFAERLEDAINRSERAKLVKMIEGQVIAGKTP